MQDVREAPAHGGPPRTQSSRMRRSRAGSRTTASKSAAAGTTPAGKHAGTTAKGAAPVSKRAAAKRATPVAAPARPPRSPRSPRSPRPPRPPRRLAGLDGLRALAVAAVVAYHAGLKLPGGFLGVDIFFVISGFLITSLLMDERARTGRIRLRAFYARRARRLLPGLGLLLAAAIVGTALLWRDAASQVRLDALFAAGFATNWWYVLHHVSYFAATGRPPLLQHLWSLAVEEQFYLLWPLALLVLAQRRRLALACCAAGALASTALMAGFAVAGDIPYGTDSTRVYFGTDTHAMGLLCGAALALWRAGRTASPAPARPRRSKAHSNRTRRSRRWPAELAGLLALGALGWAVADVSEFSRMLYRGGFLAVSLAATVLVAAATAPRSRLGRALDVAPLRWLGERSYGIYLWHWPVVVVTRPGLDVTWPGWCVAGVRIGAAVALAALSYRFVERPLRCGRPAPRRRLAEVPPDAPAAPAPAPSPVPVSHRRSALTACIGTGCIAVLVIGLTASDPYPSATLTAEAAHNPLLLGATATAAADRFERADVRSPVRPTHRPAAHTSRHLRHRHAAPALRHDRLPAIAVGDSVMVGAAPALTVAVGDITVDATEGISVGTVIGRIDGLRAAGLLRPDLVVQTGNNGIVDPVSFDNLLASLADRHRVVVVNDRVPRDWQDENNATFAWAVRRHRNVVLLDWYHASAGHRAWFYDDGLHLRPAGASAYARLVAALL